MFPSGFHSAIYPSPIEQKYFQKMGEPMDIAGVLVSPNLEKKIKARNAAMRYKHGSPKFLDLLRKRFHRRVKDERGHLFNRLRAIDTVKTGNVSNIIQQELSSIISTEDLSEVDPDEEARIRLEIESETVSEEVNWLMQQYDLLTADDKILQQLWEESQLVVCPVCRKSNLKIDAIKQMVFCDNCPTAVPARASLPQVHCRIYAIIDNHDSTGCQNETLFFVSSEDRSLYAHCSSCSLFDLVL